MYRTLTILTLTATLALTACGSSTDEATDAPGTTSDATPVATSPAAEPATDPTTAPTGEPAPLSTDATPDTTAAPITQTTEAPAGTGGDAECLNGVWRADAAALQAQLVPVAGPLALTVGPDSFSQATLDDGNVVVDAEVVLSGAMPAPGLFLSASSTTHLEGTYTTDGNIVLADITVDTSEFGSWSATMNGEPIDLPPEVTAGFAEPPSPVPGFNGTTFDCDETSLTFDVIDSPYGTITYTRVG